MERQTVTGSGLQLAALAHDLRTPMCVAAGAAQMALEAGGKDVSAQLRQILQAVTAMDRMISMMSETQESTGRTSFTGRMLREELLGMTEDHARRKDQRLSIDLSALEGPVLAADYAALCRLLTNLLNNAMKYTQPGGEITLRAQMERGWRGKRRIRFIVADNGMGMTREFMRRMFEPYERAQDVRAVEGRGLGLMIVREMAERLGGTIHVRSAWGRGTTFVVCVPVEIKRGS